MIRGFAEEILSRPPTRDRSRVRRRPNGARTTPSASPTGRCAPRPTTAPSPIRRRSIPNGSRRSRLAVIVSRPECIRSSTPGARGRCARTARDRCASSRARTAAARCSPGDDRRDRRRRPLCTGRFGIRDRGRRDATSIGCMNTAWLFAGVDMDALPAIPRRDAGAVLRSSWRSAARRMRFFERPVVSWRDDVAVFMGPGSPAIRRSRSRTSRRSKSARIGLMRRTSTFYREHAPGFRECLHHAVGAAARRAPRPPPGRHRPRDSCARLGRKVIAPDEIGVSPTLSPMFPNISLPYGSMVPRGSTACSPRPSPLLRHQFTRFCARFRSAG